jgi:hypothetical protein
VHILCVQFFREVCTPPPPHHLISKKTRSVPCVSCQKGVGWGDGGWRMRQVMSPKVRLQADRPTPAQAGGPPGLNGKTCFGILFFLCIPPPSANHGSEGGGRRRGRRRGVSGIPVTSLKGWRAEMKVEIPAKKCFIVEGSGQ